MNSSRPLSMAKIKGACYLALKVRTPRARQAADQVSHLRVLDLESPTKRATTPSNLQAAGYSPLTVRTVSSLGTGTGIQSSHCTHNVQSPRDITWSHQPEQV